MPDKPATVEAYIAAAPDDRRPASRTSARP